MNPSPPSPLKPSCPPCWIVLLVALALLVPVLGRVAEAIEKVFAGAGSDHCCAIGGVAFTYLGLFVLLAGVVFVLLVALALKIRDLRMRVNFERRFGAKAPAKKGDTRNFSDSLDDLSLDGYQEHHYHDGDGYDYHDGS